jgi:hypothetical protein
VEASLLILSALLREALPLGFILSSEDIVGTPTKAGSSRFTVKVTDDLGSSVSKKVTIKVFKSIGITTKSLRKGKVGKRYSSPLRATGGKKPYTWSLISGNLPEGLSLDSVKGKITGGPYAIK